ncbi:MAG TPA: DUF6351 family protein [Actinomycetota bacterium]|nr:DUF6351 family protein [Actinomycetota bacterium]
MRRSLILAVVTSLLIVLPVVSQAADDVSIRVLSNRADLISGGDALVEIVLAGGVDPAGVTVDVDGRDVTSSFAVRADGRFLGRVEGLALGVNNLNARAGLAGATIPITNHAIGGPVFAGTQIQPWLCTTQSNGLGVAQDAQCNAPTVHTYHYRSTNPARTGFLAYDPNNPPADVATTTTDQGEVVPYIVRRERGTADRGIYDIAVLFDPARGWEPWARQEGWNGKIHYVFGASCGTIHSQSSPANVLDDRALSRGFMVVNSSMNNLGNNCNTVVSAEAAMMLRERVIERYGEIRFVIGSGCSGGSIGQHMVANGYPGLIDGIQPNCSYEDNWSTGMEVVDCHLLLNYYVRTSPHLWAAAQQQAFVNGHQSPTSCAAWEALFAPVADPKGGCGLPPEQEYHPQSNPGGCRGSLADYYKPVLGTRAQDGFAPLPYDNVGVQYGWHAVNSGLITAEQFVDLNEKIGAVDIDFNFAPGRRTADPGSINTLERSGQINDGAQLDEVAIIDLRGSSNEEIHTDFHTYSMRERLKKANGHADNHVIWSSHVPLVGDPVWATESFLLLDRWLTAVEADTSALPRAEKIRRNKPADAVDSCWVAGQRVSDATLCRTVVPYYGAPRIAAGGPATHDIAKCALKPLDRRDYRVSFTDGQWSRLQAVFAGGVCDWSKPGIESATSTPWMTFAGGPGGQPLPAPPVSQSL